MPWFQSDTSLTEDVTWFSAGKLKKPSCLNKELYHSTQFICALTQLCSLAAPCQRPQGYLCVLLLYKFCMPANSAAQILFFQGKHHLQTSYKSLALDLYLCALTDRAGPYWTASSAIHVQWLWRVLTLRVLNISSGFHINIEFRLQELPEGNKHSQFMFSGHFKSFW